MDLFLGTIVLWPIPWIPEGFNACDGTMLNVQQNAALFSLISDTFGGNGTTTFAVPDLRGRVPVGVGAAPQMSRYTYAQVGGEESTQVTMQVPPGTQIGEGYGDATGNLFLHEAQLPAHSHGLDAVTVAVSIPANTDGGTTDTPGNTTILAKGTVVGGPVNTTAKSYTTVAANANLAPIDVTIPASSTQTTGSATAIPITLGVDVLVATRGITMNAEVPIVQPFLALNYMICLSGMYPPRP